VNINCPQRIFLSQIWHMFSQPMLHTTISKFVQFYWYSTVLLFGKNGTLYLLRISLLFFRNFCWDFSDVTHIREVFSFCACMKIMFSVPLSKNTKKKMRSFAFHVDFNKCRSLSLSVRPLIRLVAAQMF